MSTAAAPSSSSSSAAEVLAKGLEGIIAGETSICSIEQGGLFYRGYEIHDLAQHASFEEVAFLLLEGHKPGASELARFKSEIVAERAIPALVIDFLKSAGPMLKTGTAVPMDVLRTAVSLLGHLDKECQDNSPPRTFASPSGSWPRSPRSSATCSA
jgi:citrate synthase